MLSLIFAVDITSTNFRFSRVKEHDIPEVGYYILYFLN